MTLDRSAPREDLIRMGGRFVTDRSTLDGERVVVLRADDEVDPAAGRLMFGYAAVFDTWTEIDSWEGTFKERIAKGAFRKSLDLDRDNIQVLFNHGFDFSIGDKPLGKPREMREDKDGLYVEVPLSRTSYNEDIIALLRDGALRGMSFRMTIKRDEWEHLEEDDDRMPERTIKEVKLWEFGPVTFPAYEATSAGVRAHARDAYQRYLEARQAEQREVIEIQYEGRTLRAQLLNGSLRSESSTEEPAEPAAKTEVNVPEPTEPAEPEPEVDTLDDPEDENERARVEASIERERKYRREIEYDKVRELAGKELELAGGRYGHL